MTTSQEAAELKNRKLEILSGLFRPLSQHLGRDKRRVLNPGITFAWHCNSTHYSNTHYSFTVIKPSSYSQASSAVKVPPPPPHPHSRHCPQHHLTCATSRLNSSVRIFLSSTSRSVLVVSSRSALDWFSLLSDTQTFKNFYSAFSNPLLLRGAPNSITAKKNSFKMIIESVLERRRNSRGRPFHIHGLLTQKRGFAWAW